MDKKSSNEKLCGAIDTLDGRNAIHRHLDMSERWDHAKLMKFHRAKCKVQHMRQGNLKHKYRLVENGLRAL